MLIKIFRIMFLHYHFFAACRFKQKRLSSRSCNTKKIPQRVNLFARIRLTFKTKASFLNIYNNVFFIERYLSPLISGLFIKVVSNQFIIEYIIENIYNNKSVRVIKVLNQMYVLSALLNDLSK